jgi:hypothetical protein
MKRKRDLLKQRAYEREWYARNRKKVMAKVKARKRKVVEGYRAFKRTLACLLCGECDPVTLDFHHRDPSAKDFLPSRACSTGWTIRRILAEIAKCDVLCANCHRKLHRDLRLRKPPSSFATDAQSLFPFTGYHDERLD